MLISETDDPSEALIEPLAEDYRTSGYDTRALVSRILRSRLFFDPAVRRQRVKSPVELVVGALRALEVVSPTLSGDTMAEACDRMGERLFAPPSVAGWDQGEAWINSARMLARTNFALELLKRGDRFDPEALAAAHGHSDRPVDFYVDLLVQDAFDATTRDRIQGDAREAASLVLTAPEYQLA